MRAQAVGRNFRVLTAFLLALLGPRLLGAEDKPLIGVDVRIEAPNFLRNLRHSINEVETDLSQLVADFSADRHEFLTWQPLNKVRDLSLLSAILHVAVTQDAGGAIVLRFWAEAGRAASSFDCPNGAPGTVRFGTVTDLNLPLFSRLEPQSGIAATLLDKIQAVLKGPVFRDTLGKVFASKIPVCHVAERRETGLVAIGLNRSDLNMEEGSKMEIDLCSLDHGSNGGSILGLEAAVRSGIYPKGPKGEWIQGRVSSCQFGGLENDSCKSKIPQMFERPLGAPDVFMIDFTSRYSCTNGSQATCPGK